MIRALAKGLGERAKRLGVRWAKSQRIHYDGKKVRRDVTRVLWAAFEPMAGLPEHLDFRCREGQSRDRLRKCDQLDDREILGVEEGHRIDHPAARRARAASRHPVERAGSSVAG